MSVGRNEAGAGRRYRLAALSVILAVLGGCASGVAPWQRGYLAEPGMQIGDDAGARLERQYYSSREAARGGQAFGGTGCGCN